MKDRIVVDPVVIFNGKKYHGTCVICEHSAPHQEVEMIVCTKDVDLRRIDLSAGKPNWCPLKKRSELDYIKSC